MAEYMRNALFGLAVGDALGVPHEKKPRRLNRIEKECGRMTRR